MINQEPKEPGDIPEAPQPAGVEPEKVPEPEKKEPVVPESEPETVPEAGQEAYVPPVAGMEAPPVEEEGPPPPSDEEIQEILPPPTQTWFSRMLHFLFSPDTHVGRVMRPFLRTTAFIVGFFALGVLAAYLLLYRPENQALKAARGELAAARTQIAVVEEQGRRTQADLDASRNRVNEVMAVLESREARINLLLLENHIAEARLALANRDGPRAQAALTAARESLQPLLPVIRTIDRELADSLDMRLALSLNELSRDPKTAASDLELLDSALELVDKKMGN